MKFTLFLTVLATLIATVTALDTNAARLARGLNPLAPVRRATGTDTAADHHPSGKPHGWGPPSSSCSGGSVQCCDSVSNSDDPFAQRVAGLVGADIIGAGPLGLGCSSILNIANSKCNSNTVCCSNNNFNGLIALGCNNINL